MVQGIWSVRTRNSNPHRLPHPLLSPYGCLSTGHGSLPPQPPAYLEAEFVGPEASFEFTILEKRHDSHCVHISGYYVELQRTSLETLLRRLMCSGSGSKAVWGHGISESVGTSASICPGLEEQGRL